MISHPEITSAQLLLLKERIELLEPVPDEDFAGLAGVLHYKEVRKKEILLAEGQVCKSFYFVLKGLVRGFSIHEGREVNINFFFENDVASDFYSLRHDTPSNIFLVAMEPCQLLCASKADFKDIFEGSMPLTSVIMRFFQNMFFNEEAHSTSFKSLTPVERYQYVMEHQAHLIQRIPLTYLASYLGISRETLSRIRSRIS